MRPIEPIEILLDKPRRLLISRGALFRAEPEVNKRRFAKPEDYAGIFQLVVEGYNRIFRSMGVLPLDLLVCLIWAGLVYDDPKEKRLTIDQVAAMLDAPDFDLMKISTAVWTSFFLCAGDVLKLSDSGDAGDGEKKTDPPTGLPNGASRESS